MPEVANFVRHHAAQITPHTLEKLMHRMALLKAEFTQIEDPKYPHLVDQLEFLANVVEDFADNQLPHMPYHAVSAAAFALLYVHRHMDIIPDFIKQHGHADDSAIVRAALIEHENAFRAYALEQGVDWSEITLNK
jgi:uncharacterized membrane protein YkvA (DUF1232 family)